MMTLKITTIFLNTHLREIAHSVDTQEKQMSKERAQAASSVLKPGPYSFLSFSSALYWLHLHSLNQFVASGAMNLTFLLTAMIHAGCLTSALALKKIVSAVMIVAYAPAFAAVNVWNVQVARKFTVARHARE